MGMKWKLLAGLGMGLLLLGIPAVNVQAAEGGREVPHYDLRDKQGTWDGENFYLLDGTKVVDAFFCDGTYTYYLMADGTPMKDRLSYHPDGEHVIYFDEYGHEVFSDFANVKKSISGEAVDDFCFFDVYGYLYVDVVTYDKTGTVLYYANPYGVMERGKWFQFSDTVMCADGTPWEGAAGGYGYANEDGTLMTDTWTYDWEGRKCYMQGNGVALYTGDEEEAGEQTAIRQRETEHFVFYCTNRDTGALDGLANSLEACYGRVTSDLGRAPAGKTDVHIYPDLDAFHEAMGRPDDPAWSAGEARDGSLYMVSPLNPGPSHNYNDMMVIAVHEYVHIVVEQFNRRQPSYLNEGIACYEAGQNGGCQSYINSDKANGTLPALSELTGSDGFLNMGDSGRAYAYCYVYVDFIVKTSGFDTVVSLLEGKTQTEAFGMSEAALNESWMNFLRSY